MQILHMPMPITFFCFVNVIIPAIAQPPKQVHSSPMWHMKDNGQEYFCCSTVFFIEVLVKSLEAVEAGQNCRF